MPALLLGGLLAGGALAQDTQMPMPESNGDARAEYAAAYEAAEEALAAGTAEGFTEAGNQYLRAATIAEDSGDDELVARVNADRESALQAYADAAQAYAGQQAFDQAAGEFLRAAEVAGTLGNTELQARLTGNAGNAYLQADDHAGAVAQFEAAYEINPEILDFLHRRAVVLQQTGDLEAAAAAYNELATQAEAAGDDENLARGREGAGRLHLLAARDLVQAQNFRGAITELDRAAEFLPEDDGNLNTLYANAYYRLGVGQVQAEQLRAAQTSLQRAQQYARTAGRDQIVQGAQQQLDYIREVLD